MPTATRSAPMASTVIRIGSSSDFSATFLPGPGRTVVFGGRKTTVLDHPPAVRPSWGIEAGRRPSGFHGPGRYLGWGGLPTLRRFCRVDCVSYGTGPHPMDCADAT